MSYKSVANFWVQKGQNQFFKFGVRKKWKEPKFFKDLEG